MTRPGTGLACMNFPAAASSSYGTARDQSGRRRTVMSRCRLLAALALLALAGAAWGQGVEVEPVKEWGGKFDDTKLKKEAPKGGLITDAKAFEKLWKAWFKGQELPKVDFTKRFAVVTLAGGPNELFTKFKLDKGDLKVEPAQTLVGGPGFGFSIAVFDRKGIRKVDGKELPKPPKPKPKEGEPEK
jgi:hypothetical protein